jgi:catechol 2,3-dioxygenase-like lactoylglutathione lyase family enzyme
MISGAHVILYSRDAEADRAFLRDVLGLPHVDAGNGWLIFGLPPAEVAVHPSDRNDLHQLYLMCDDVRAMAVTLAAKKAACGPVVDRGWGLLTDLHLPGGGVIGLYQPRHPRPEPMRPAAAGGS